MLCFHPVTSPPLIMAGERAQAELGKVPAVTVCVISETLEKEEWGLRGELQTMRRHYTGAICCQSPSLTLDVCACARVCV